MTGKNPATTLKDLLLACGAIKLGDFVLTSGKRSPYYVDIKMASTRPDILSVIAAEMERTAAAGSIGFARIAGMELGAVPLAVALALRTSRPYVIIRKGERAHGTGRTVEGTLAAGDEVLVVEDVATTGGSIRRCVVVLRQAGATVSHALCVVDREEGAEEALRADGVELHSLLRAREILPQSS